MAILPSPGDPGLPRSSGIPSVQVARGAEIPTDTATGRAWENFGALLHQETQKLDAYKAEDALNQIKQARLDLTMGEGGAYTVKGGSVLAEGYVSGYKDRLNTTISGIMAGLSPAQQQKLQPYADSEVRGMHSDILRHSMSEAERYRGLVRQGSLDTAVSAGIEQYNDPVAFGRSVDALKATVKSIAAEQGLTGKDEAEQATAEAMYRKAASPLYVGAITKALDGKDPKSLARAEQLYNEGRFAIEPNARLQIGEAIGKAKDALSTQESAKDFMTGVVAPANTPTAKLATAVITSALTHSESRGRDTAPDGTILLGPVIEKGSAKGQQAVGAHQMLVGTAEDTAKRNGLTWDKELFYAPSKEGRAYRDQLQTAHVNGLIAQFDTVQEVAAAYNAGAGSVRQAKKDFAKYQGLVALAQKDPTVKPIPPASYNAAEGPITFLDFLPQPKVTKPYVKEVMQTAKAAPDIVKPTVADIEAQMTAKYPDRPDLAKAATGLVKHQLDVMEAGRKGEIEGAKDSAYKFMAQGKLYEDLPPSLLAKLPPLEQEEVKGHFKSFLQNSNRDSNPHLIYQINSDPGLLARTPNSVWNGAMRLQLSEYDWRRLDTQRNAKLGGDVEKAQQLDDGAIGHILAQRMRMLELDPTPKETDKTGIARVNSARAVIEQSVLKQQADLGRKLTETELRQNIDTLFSRTDAIKGIFTETRKPAMSATYSDIPAAERDKILDGLKSKGVANPTNTQVLTVYKQIRAGLL